MTKLEEKARVLAERAIPFRSWQNMDDRERDDIAAALVAFAREHAERALRHLYEIDDHDQPTQYDDSESAIIERRRSRGGYRVKPEYAGPGQIEKRHYRKEFEEMIAAALAAAEEGTT